MIKYLFLYFGLILSLVQNVSASPLKLLIIGDSLSAGYEMPIQKSWASLLPDELKKHDININLINASISGDTTTNGLEKITDLLKEHQPDWVLIELGANDGLRGFQISIIEQNLVDMIKQIKQTKSRIMLQQVMLPPNYGKRYSEQFQQIYSKVSKKYQIPLLPFFLVPIIKDHPEWMKSDQLHPSEKAQPFIAEFIAKEMAPILKTAH